MFMAWILMLSLSRAQETPIQNPSITAAPVTWSGQVLEKGTRKPLPDVNVFVLPHKVKAVTGPKGDFQFESLPTGAAEIVINISGYNRFQQSVEIGEGAGRRTFFVEKISYQYETEITGLGIKKDQSQKRLSQKEFLQVPGAGGDPVKAVQNLPGVNRTSGGDARIVIQGASPEDTRYNIEGHEVPLIFHFGGLSSIVTPEAVGSVDYFSAGYGPELSRALGGHVGLNVRKPQTDRVHAIAFMDIFNLGGLVEGPIDEQSSYLVSGRYSYVGNVLKAAAKNNENFNLTVAPVFYDFNAQYHRKLNERDEMRVFGIFSRDELQFVLARPIGNDPKLRGSFERTTEFYRVIPQWSRQLDGDSKVTLSAAAGVNNINFNIGSNYFDLKSQSFSLRSDYERKLSSHWKANVGVDNDYNWAKVKVKIPSTFSEGGVANPISTGELRETESTARVHGIGLYWRNEIKTSDESPWTYLPSLRADRFSLTRETLLSPRAAVKYAWDATLTLRGATGLYFQQPEPQEVDNAFGNPSLKAKRAVHVAIGFDKDFRSGESEGITLSSSVFYKKLDRLVISSSTLVNRDGALTAENYSNNGTGTIAGVEFQSKYRWNQWGLTGSYTYLQSRRKSPDAAELPSPYDQTHSLNFLVSYEEGNWQYGSRLRYVTGNPYTPVVGSSYDADNDVYIPQRGSLYSDRNKAFFQVDLRVDRKWVYDTWILSGYLDIQNLTNQKNQEGLTYSYDYSQKQEVTGLPLLPSLGVRGEF